MKGRQKAEQPMTREEQASFEVRVSQTVMENNRLGHENAWMRDKLRKQADEIATLSTEVERLSQFKPAPPPAPSAAQAELFS